MLGFSVYLGNALDKEYILNMASMGYDVIFTSLQIPEETSNISCHILGNYVSFSSYNITYIIDVNPSLLNPTLYSYLNQLPHGAFLYVLMINWMLNSSMKFKVMVSNAVLMRE